ncbi:MAG: hypothetical protein JO215_08980 [Ktedonobacteraceae bacterium]|nr:hypothetical protein [Ktedonobacteraceae bacterium]MBV9709340.1 hypothetical protein [Ktedonobacteraceae bacterium]
MATIGIDCELILDGTGYFIKPGTYRAQQPRIRKMIVRADGGLSYVDLGPGKRTWSMVVLCLNDLLRYDGATTGWTGQQYRDALRSSYSSSSGTTIQFSDPTNATAVAVHFDGYKETITDLHMQQIPLATGGTPGLSYEVTVELVEA